MSFEPMPRLARVIPIHPPERGWQGELLPFLLSNPRHLDWLLARTTLQHYLDEILFPHLVQSHAEEVTLYHSAWRFEIDFRVWGRRHRVEVPHQRWALPVFLALKRRAGMDLMNPVVWQIGEIALPNGLRIATWSYPTRVSERLVLRPRWREWSACAPEPEAEPAVSWS